MTALENFLKKIGVKSYEDLTPEERATYRSWEATLSGARLTDEDAQRFLHADLEASIQKLIHASLKEREDTFLKMKIDLLRRLLAYLEAPKVEKKLLEQNLTQ